VPSEAIVQLRPRARAGAFHARSARARPPRPRQRLPAGGTARCCRPRLLTAHSQRSPPALDGARRSRRESERAEKAKYPQADRPANGHGNKSRATAACDPSRGLHSAAPWPFSMHMSHHDPLAVNHRPASVQLHVRNYGRPARPTSAGAAIGPRRLFADEAQHTRRVARLPRRLKQRAEGRMDGPRRCCSNRRT
jgi:hypothetical protein